MEFSVSKSIEIISRTPQVLQSLLGGLSEDWTAQNEGENTWSPFDVVGHLIHAEKTDWIPRMEIILSESRDKSFPPFDRFAQLRNNTGKTMRQLLQEFADIRKRNVGILESRQLTSEELSMTGFHPEFGEVTLVQLLATWTVHDLNHIVQICRTMAKQYRQEVGPWTQYLLVIQR